MVHHRKKTGGFGKTAVCLYTGVIFAFIRIIGAAVFELYGEGNVGKEFIWMDSGSLDKFIVGNSLTVLLKAVMKNYNCSKNSSWVNKERISALSELGIEGCRQ